MAEKVVKFPTDNVSLGDAIAIVKSALSDENISFATKLLALEQVTDMPTHNSITKDDLIGALRWLFSNYDFER